MTETESLQAKYAAKINALLRKAETTTPEEAEALTDKAQELMSKYAIESGMLEATKDQPDEKIIIKRVHYAGLYSKALREIACKIAWANGCKVTYSTGYGAGKKGGDTAAMEFIGFESDVERAVNLDMSVQIQAQVALRKWSRDNLDDWMSRQQKSHSKRDFLFGFGSGVESRLHKARDVAKKNTVTEMAAETGEDEASVTKGVELMVRSRRERLNDWYDQKYGNLRSSRSVSYKSGGTGGRSAGYRAGAQANTGSSGALKSRKALSA